MAAQQNPLDRLSPRARDQIMAEVVRKVALMRRVRQGVNEYVPQGSAAEILSCTDDEVLAAGPAGTGKSRAWLQKIHWNACDYPRSRWLVMRKTRESVTDSILVTFEQHVLGEDHPLIGGLKRENRHAYYYPNGSEIVIGGMNKASRVLSTEYDGIYVAEADEFEEDEIETLTTRLGRSGPMPYQQLMMDCNPNRPDHWIKVRCDSGRARMITSVHEDNPTLYNAATGEWTPRGVAYLRRLGNLTGVRLQRYRYGRWVGAEGAIYDQFTPSIHLVDRFDPPRHWRRIRVIDFGFIHPFVCQWWAISDDGIAYLYREIYLTHTLVQDHAELIKSLSVGENIECTIADHDAEDRATLERCGITTVLADKDVSPGIQAVQFRLRIRADGKPGMRIMRDALAHKRDPYLVERKQPTCTADEISGYVWAKGTGGKPDKETPVKVRDDGMDAMRYHFVYLDGKPAIKWGSVGRSDVSEQVEQRKYRNKLEEMYEQSLLDGK